MKPATLKDLLSRDLESISPRQVDSNGSAGPAQEDQGIGIVSFLTAFTVALIIFAVQSVFFLLLRNKLARIFKPKTYLVPERERTPSPPSSFFPLLKTLLSFPHRNIIHKCGLDAYFFLRYLRTLLVIFIPIASVVMPVLIPLNYVDGRGTNINVDENDRRRKFNDTVTGLDTLAWSNVKAENTSRYTAHLLMAILVVIWICTVFFFELKVYIKVRQDYLTSAEHRLRASATTVLISQIPSKWLTEEALFGLFDVFPGGVRNIWLNRDLSELLDKIALRCKYHEALEQAETDLIKAAKKAQRKQEKMQTKQTAHMNRKERAADDAMRDAKAVEMATRYAGINAGEPHEVPHIDMDSAQGNQRADHGHEKPGSKWCRMPPFGDRVNEIDHGIKGVINKAYHGVRGEEALETINGFVSLTSTQESIQNAAHQPLQVPGQREAAFTSSTSTAHTSGHCSPANLESSLKPKKKTTYQGLAGNTVRQLENLEDQFIKEETKFWQFWKPPTGGYASPVPQGRQAADFVAKEAADNTTAWHKFKEAVSFLTSHTLTPIEYKQAINAENQDQDETGAVWEKYLKAEDRPTHHLLPFGNTALFRIPLITKKVDTIHYCRKELARLNVEIEEDQNQVERYPLMNSAFVQFEQQVAAHMACQSTIHHLPKHMSPRIVEISPRDVLWENMAMSWWQVWARSFGVVCLIVAMVISWTIPVAFTATLGQLDELIAKNGWLSWLDTNSTVRIVAETVAGVLPAALLAIMLILAPIIFAFLGGFRGAKTGTQKAEFVQIFYFFFLFVQVFLIVSVASFFAASINELVQSIEQLSSASTVLDLLATNLPKAANYFFSYMILQALSTSSGTLLQIGTLFVWFILARIIDSTARAKWRRSTTLNTVDWGKFFPVYTNFACIGIIYSIIAPLISVFAIITFSLLWLAHNYSMLYVTRFEHDTGGILYPRAINQTFTGIYFMEICVAGLFFIVKDENGNNVCALHGITMLVVTAFTVLYQVLLNRSFSPLFRYLPITLEDEAVLRDETFRRAQNRRLGLEEYDEEKDDEAPSSPKTAHSPGQRTPRLGSEQGEEMEMEKLRQRRRSRAESMRNPIKYVGAFAKAGGDQVSDVIGTDQSTIQSRKYAKDLEVQRAIGDALYGGMDDEIEDLTPDERDLLVRHAFKHSALRARRPVVWIPRDDLGISDDEIRRTQAYSDNIWISNEGTALDSKTRVVYGKNPPDFLEVDVINL
ncbi:uncharacterized protein F5Z01DRAFT_349304 [Emericellopsis atlantica]|uniref:DUF221 domain protein n=1 Tax=Emericellopsis atlantica TaxID=2614577 RepID=A0A9P8CKJ1_9HYPO|nr:uncharacterized protein F5Z01DRAFT_349304 [Emericellopsis atlantica]KAG9250619.1 hypothetical protein F5Z01DRAFT_349304 [Emericellopsis atlantica]